MGLTTTKNGSLFPPSKIDSSAFIAAARRKDRSPEGKIESAKKASEAHFETHTRYFYLTVKIILGDKAFEDLEELEQIDDPDLILPEGVDRELIRAEILQAQNMYPPISQVVFPRDHQFTGRDPMIGLLTAQEMRPLADTASLTQLCLGSSMMTDLSGSTTQVPSDLSPEERTAANDFDYASLFLKDPDEEDENGKQDTENQHNQAEEANVFNLVDGAEMDNGWIDGFTPQDMSCGSYNGFCPEDWREGN